VQGKSLMWIQRREERRRLSSTAWRALATAIGLVAVAGPLCAQSAVLGPGPLFRDDVAGTRTEPEFALDRINLGGFALESSISATGGYDSNVFNRNDSQGDAFLLLTPRIGLTRNEGRNRTSFSAGGLVRRQARLTAENSVGYDANLNNTLILSGGSSLSAALAAARVAEPRGTSGVGQGNAEPVIRHDLTGSLGGTVQLGGIGLSANLRGNRQRFDNVLLRQGGKASQAFRDLDTVAGTLEAAIPIGSNLSGVVDVGYDVQRSPNASPALSRDADGMTLQAGLRGYLSQLIAAEIRVGLRTRDFDNPRFSRFRGVYYSGTVDWYPLELVSLRATADRFLANSGIGNSAGATVRREGLTVFYDPLPALRVTAAGTHTRERFREVGLTDQRYDAAVNARYLFTPHLSASLRLARNRLRSTDQRLLQSFSATVASFSTTYSF
jgi:hypothetical protein